MPKNPKKISPFGAVLVSAREARGVTQYQLAKRLNCTQQQLAKWEHGDNEPGLAAILRMARALDMDPCDLLRDAFRRMDERNPERFPEQ